MQWKQYPKLIMLGNHFGFIAGVVRAEKQRGAVESGNFAGILLTAPLCSYKISGTRLNDHFANDVATQFRSFVIKKVEAITGKNWLAFGPRTHVLFYFLMLVLTT